MALIGAFLCRNPSISLLDDLDPTEDEQRNDSDNDKEDESHVDVISGSMDRG